MSTVPSLPVSGKTRPLTFADLTRAYQLPFDALSDLALPIVTGLRSLPAPVGHDPAGVAKRGSTVFEPYLEGQPIDQLAAAYVYLRNLGCQSGLIDRFEITEGVE